MICQGEGDAVVCWVVTRQGERDAVVLADDLSG